MNWKQVLFISCLTTCVLLIVFEGGDAVATGTKTAAAGESSKKSLKKRVFMQESNASNFFKKWGKRATKSRYELNVETYQMLAAYEQRREYYEEQQDEFDEEEHDEQDERSREQIEQWLEYHFDVLYLPYLYNHPFV